MSPSAEASPGSPPPDHAGVPLPPPLIYVGGLLAGLGLERAMPSRRLPHVVARPIGYLAMAAGVASIAGSGALFRRSGTSVMPIRPSTALVLTGPYRFTRNPMYVGMALLHAGIAVRLRSPWAIVTLAPVIAAVQRVVIAREERYLERRFGEPYRRYKSQVPRWL